MTYGRRVMSTTDWWGGGHVQRQQRGERVNQKKGNGIKNGGVRVRERERERERVSEGGVG